MKKYISLFIVSFLTTSLMAFGVINPENPEKKNNQQAMLVDHSLTITILGHGVVSPENGDYSDYVMLEASPAVGYKFAGWSGDLTGSIPTMALVMGSDKNVTASFVAEDAPTYTVTTTMEGSGMVIKSKSSALDGEAVEIYAIPDAGQIFSKWNGDFSGNSSSARFMVGRDITINAVFESIISPQTYYVAVQGNNSNSGDIDNPFASIEKALSLSNPGSVIYVMPGVYESTSITLKDRSGEPGNLIHIVAYDPNDKPIIKAGLNVLKCSYLHLKGFEITKTRFSISGIDAHHNIYEDFDVHHVLNSQVAFNMYNHTHDNIVLNCDFHNNVLFAGSNADGIAMWGNENNTDGPYNNSVISCRSFFNNDDGFDTWWAGSNNRFESCWAYGNGRDSTFSDIDGDGNGFKLGAGYGSVLMTNCLTWKNKMIGISQNGNKGGGHSILNCTAYDNSYLNIGFWQIPRSSVVINCISHEGNLDLSAADDQYNTWNMNNVSVTDTDFVTLDYSLNMNDRNPDGSLPESGFLSLEMGSDLIDRGMNVGMPFLGNAPDLGAYESIPDPTTSVNSFGESFASNTYPNPFSDHTNFVYEVSNLSNVKLVIYNIIGEEIAVLVDQKQQSGQYKTIWNPGEYSQLMSSQAIYLWKLSIGSDVQTGKIIHILK